MDKINEELNEELEHNEETNDLLVEEGESYGVVEQSEEEFLAFSIDNLYTDAKEKKYRGPLALRKDPPVLEISSSNGSEVNVPLTYEFTQSLGRVIKDVNYAYLGLKKTKKFKVGDVKKVNLSDIARKNKYTLASAVSGMIMGIALAKGAMAIAVIAVVIGVAAVVMNTMQKGE